jgi:HK97 family phage major capsid protein
MTALRAKLYEPERKEADFSLLAFIRHCLDKAEGGPERQYVSAFNLRKDVENARIGEYIPPRALGNVRAMNVTTDTAGGFLVAEDTRADDFVAYLFPVLLAGRLGVPSWPGLVGNAVVPAGTIGATPYWLDTEGGAPPESTTVAFGNAVLSPKTVGALLPLINRNLLLLGTRRSVEPILQALLKTAIASGVDGAFFAGSGSDGEPLGVLNTPGIDTRSGAAFALATATAMLKVLEDGSIATEGASWVMDPASAKLLRKREKGAAGNPVYLLGDDNKMAGRTAYVSASIPAGTILLGNFPEGAAIASWGPGVELIVDDKTRSKEGQVRLIGFASIDVFVRRTAAFAIATGVS